MLKICTVQLAVLTVITALFFAGFIWDLYETVWWWDIVLHFLGGLWIGMWVIGLSRIQKIKLDYKIIISLVFAVGFAWEVFEYFLGIGGSAFMSYRLDTAKDLLNDCLGAWASISVAKKLKI